MQPRSVNILDEGRSLAIEWQSGKHDVFTAHRLWSDCPSAAARRQRIDGDRSPSDPDLRIVAVNPIGRYGINIAFSDGHARGIYPWALLRGFAGRATVEDFLLA